MMTKYAACLGIDWADKKHDLCLVDSATGKQTKQVLAHTPQAIAEYFTNLRRRYPGQLIAVGLEQSRGPLLFALLQYDFLVLYPLNPTTLAKYREAFTPSRAKDDPSDAEYAAEPSLTSGSESSGSVGKPARPTLKLSILRHSVKRALPCYLMRQPILPEREIR